MLPKWQRCKTSLFSMTFEAGYSSPKFPKLAWNAGVPLTLQGFLIMVIRSPVQFGHECIQHSRCIKNIQISFILWVWRIWSINWCRKRCLGNLYTNHINMQLTCISSLRVYTLFSYEIFLFRQNWPIFVWTLTQIFFVPSNPKVCTSDWPTQS